MKKLLLTPILLLFINSIGFSQDFGAVGTEWHYDNNDYFLSYKSGYHCYKSVKDTVISGKTTHKITIESIRGINPTVSLGHFFVYESNDTVYINQDSLGSFEVMMVYNLNKGILYG